MKKRVERVKTAARLAAALIVMCTISGPQSSGADAGGPPRSGWMEGFEPAAAGGAPVTGVLVGKDGRKTALAAFRGKPALVNFWATWCAPCLRELPSLARLQARLGDDVAVLAVSQDFDGWDAIAPFLDRHRITGLAFYHDPRARLGRSLGVGALPTTVLIGRQGRELGRLAGPAEWDSPEALALLRHYLGR